MNNKNNNYKQSTYVKEAKEAENPIKLKMKNEKEIDVKETIKNNIDHMPTTTQLRLLLSNSVVIKNKIEIDKNKFNNSKEKKDKYTLSDDIQRDIKYLLIKHIYQCGKDKDKNKNKEYKLNNFDKAFNISEKIEEIENSDKAFDDYYRYLEEIVAYVKYYVG